MHKLIDRGVTLCACQTPLPAAGTVVECPPGERLSLPPQLPHAPAATAQAASGLPHVDLCCLDNSLGTFYAATAQHPAPQRSFDLRNPLGITPAALLAMGAATEVGPAAPRLDLYRTSPDQQQQQQPREQQAQAGAQQTGLQKQQEPADMFRSFQTSRRQLRTETEARLVTPSGGWQGWDVGTCYADASSAAGASRLGQAGSSQL